MCLSVCVSDCVSVHATSRMSLRPVEHMQCKKSLASSASVDALRKPWQRNLLATTRRTNFSSAPCPAAPSRTNRQSEGTVRRQSHKTGHDLHLIAGAAQAPPTTGHDLHGRKCQGFHTAPPTPPPAQLVARSDPTGHSEGQNIKHVRWISQIRTIMMRVVVPAIVAMTC